MTVTFDSPLIFRAEMDGTWTVHEPFLVAVDRERITVPPGFNTDLASVPRLLWPILPPFGEYEEAAVVHDYLYRVADGRRHSRAEADRIFLEGMRDVGVGWFKARLMHAAVRAFGWLSFSR